VPVAESMNLNGEESVVFNPARLTTSSRKDDIKGKAKSAVPVAESMNLNGEESVVFNPARVTISSRKDDSRITETFGEGKKNIFKRFRGRFGGNNEKNKIKEMN